MISLPIFKVCDTVDSIRNRLFAGSKKHLVKRQKAHFCDFQDVLPNRITPVAEFEGRIAFEFDMDDTLQKCCLVKEEI
jgi:hypothetical protein